jgi:ATPase subunit of ABC transporter with duplicated ATPase domains
MTFGRLMLKKHNVMLLDEPTNHLDMESIESLQLALDKYPGTLFFVSHDREFVSALATRIWEIQPNGHVVDYRGPYEEFLASKGIED